MGIRSTVGFRHRGLVQTTDALQTVPSLWTQAKRSKRRLLSQTDAYLAAQSVQQVTSHCSPSCESSYSSPLICAHIEGGLVRIRISTSLNLLGIDSPIMRGAWGLRGLVEYLSTYWYANMGIWKRHRCECKSASVKEKDDKHDACL